MMEPLYVAGATPLHRLPAGIKLVLLALAGAALFAVQDVRWLGMAFVLACCAVWSTGVAGAALWRQVRGLLWILGALAFFTVVFEGWWHAAAVLCRTSALVALGLAVTLCTRSLDMIAACERGLRPFERLGLINAGRTALAFALALRFVPEIWRNFEEIREAQMARGIGAHPLALIVPLVVRTLKRADEIAEAIDARV